MPDNNIESAAEKRSYGEPVCIDTRRVYDSCGDKDCLSDLPVFVSPTSQELIDNAVSVRIRSADVLNTMIDIEPVPFNRGFYSIDITFFFSVILDVFSSPNTSPTQVTGLCMSDKKVILYGSEGNVRVFSSDMALDEYDSQNMPARSLPTASACREAVRPRLQIQAAPQGAGVPAQRRRRRTQRERRESCARDIRRFLHRTAHAERADADTVLRLLHPREAL